MKKTSFLNCFYDLTPGKKYELPKQKFLNFYLKTKLSKLKKLNLTIDASNLTIEITNIDFNYLNEDIYKNISKYKNIKKIILNYPIISEKDIDIKNKNFEIIKELEKFNFCELGIDFLIGNILWSFKDKLKIFLKKYTNIKYFSVYFIDDSFDGIYIKNKFLNFQQYHRNTWTSNKDIRTSYDFAILKYRNYLGIGEGAISRISNDFYEFIDKKSGWKLKKMENISNEFISFNDHMSRLEFYEKINNDELEMYQKIEKEEYESLLKEHKNNIYTVHDLMIHKLILNNIP